MCRLVDKMPYVKKKRSNRSWKKTSSRGMARRAMNYGPVSNKKRKFTSLINAVVNRHLETKTAVTTSADGLEIFHNNFVSLDSDIMQTTQGTSDPVTTNTLCRIGDKIHVKGVSMKLMLELNERYSDVTFRILVIKFAKGDTPTRTTLFNGISGNKMLDTLNTERYTIIAQKYIQMKAPNNGNRGTDIGAYVIPVPLLEGKFSSLLCSNFLL